MKSLLTIVVAMLISGGAHGQGQGKNLLSAEFVSDQCKQINSENPITANFAAGTCTMLLVGFIDGMRQGAYRGLRSAFIDDPKNLATGDGIEDVWSRISQLSPRAACIPAGTSPELITYVFVDYMGRNKNRKDEHYSGPLVDAIQARFCPVKL